MIADMVRAYRKGAEIVLGVRNDRSSDTFFKRSTAQLYYWLLRLMGVNTVMNHADFRLLGRHALAAIHSFGETQLFLRGIIRLVGFRQELVHYRRDERWAGTTKYSLLRMLGLALNGITSFTAFPLRLITLFGVVVSVLAFLAGTWALLSWWIFANTVPGWTSVVLPMYFLGGIQLLSIGIIGEYLGKELSRIQAPSALHHRKTNALSRQCMLKKGRWDAPGAGFPLRRRFLGCIVKLVEYLVKFFRPGIRTYRVSAN